MKKIMMNIIFTGLISIMIFPLCVSAKTISTLETTVSNGKITISGTTETGVLAVAALVYSGSDLVYMETCNADGSSYSCILNKKLSAGDYVVKVADYDGGDYSTDNISITSNVEINPQTGDMIMSSLIISAIALIGLFGTVLYTKKNIIKL